MKINMPVRLLNRSFWLTIVPAVALLVQVCAAPFGYEWDFGVLNEQLCAVINAAFGVLAVVGIVNDPTTDGLSDSTRAMHYETPSKE